MNNDDNVSFEATATGILQCLRMLAEEAATLHMTRTFNALREAIRACAAERTEIAFDTAVESVPDRVIH